MSNRPSPTNTGTSDVSYINLSGTFYYLCSVLDGYSRFLVHWDLRESMTEAEIEVILERAKEKYPEAKPRIISDNGPQFIARDFKRVYSDLRHDPRANLAILSAVERKIGKVWHKSLKSECIRPLTPADAGRCAALDSNLRGSLQHGASAQRDRLCDAAGYAGGTTGGDPRGARS